MFIQTADGSIERSDGKVMYFGFDRFMTDIVRGNRCFICGVSPETAEFNNEHVLPDWILRRYGLYDKSITLPNGTTFRYAGLTIPCCAECNALMGKMFEEPISALFAKGSDAVNRALKENGPWQLFCWMCLVFVKTHLKDKNLNLHLDTRKGETKIAELHDWSDLHHIHCMARAFYTGCDLATEALGSLLVVPAKVRQHYESFDYGDLSFAKTMLLRIDETAIIAVLNDSQGALSIYQDELQKIRGPLSPLQVREIAAHLASINIHLAERPRFSSEVDLLSEECTITGHRPQELQLRDWDSEVLGKIMHHLSKDMLAPVPNKDEILEQIKTGRYSFLEDGNGNFLSDHMDLEDPLPDLIV